MARVMLISRRSQPVPGRTGAPWPSPVYVVARARPGQGQELSAMPGRFANAIFGELNCVLDISAGADSRAGRVKPLPRSFLTCRNRFPAGRTERRPAPRSRRSPRIREDTAAPLPRVRRDAVRVHRPRVGNGNAKMELPRSQLEHD
jgi:hypothetical protein